MANDWVLIETFGGRRPEPTVIAKGNSPRKMVPLWKFFRTNPYLTEIRAVIAQAKHEAASVRIDTLDGRRQIVAEPLQTYGGEMHGDEVHGVFLWIGQRDETPPPHDRAGAWHISITRYTSSRSDQLLRDVYGQSQPWQNVHTLAQLFAYGRLNPNNDEAAAVANIIKEKVGYEHIATWTVNRADGTPPRAGHFSCRIVTETTSSGAEEMFLRGITHDIGPAETVSSAPPAKPVLLAQLVMLADQTPGVWRAIVDIRKMWLIKWVHDDPVPGIAWELQSPYPPGIHHDDLPTAVRMRKVLEHDGDVSGELRFRTTDGGWMRLAVTANLMFLAAGATAALVKLTKPDNSPIPTT